MLTNMQTKFDSACDKAQVQFGLKGGQQWTARALAAATRNCDAFIEAEIGQPVDTQGKMIDSPQIPGEYEWQITFKTDGLNDYIAVIDLPDERVEA